MFNPLQLMQAIQNPQAFIQNAMNNNKMMNNPMMKNAMEMYQNGNTQGLEQLVNNVAKQKGTSVEDIRKQFGI